MLGGSKTFADIPTSYTVTIVISSVLYGTYMIATDLIIAVIVFNTFEELNKYTIKVNPFLLGNESRYVYPTNTYTMEQGRSLISEKSKDITDLKTMLFVFSSISVFDGLYSFIVLFYLLYKQEQYNLITLELSTLSLTHATLVIINIVLFNTLITKIETALDIRSDMRIRVFGIVPHESALISIIISGTIFILKNFVY